MWSLDDKSQNFLRTMAPEQLQQVFTDFNPPSDTRNYNAKLATFINNMSGGGKGQQQFGGGVAAESLSLEHQQMLQQFVQQWGLDEKATSALTNLSPANLEK